MDDETVIIHVNLLKDRPSPDKLWIAPYGDTGEMGTAWAVPVGEHSVKYLLATPERKAASGLLADCRAVIDVVETEGVLAIVTHKEIIDRLRGHVAVATSQGEQNDE